MNHASPFRGLVTAIALLLLVALAVRFAAASGPVSPINIVVSSSGSRELPTTSNGTLNAQGGNVTQVNLEALTITRTWQGYWGNITGNIHLDDAGNNSFYVWGNGTLSGEVYASRNGTIQWASINCTNVTERAAEETYLGVTPSDGDSVMNTFNFTTHPSFYVGTQPIASDSCFSTRLFQNGSQAPSAFHQMLLSDDAENLVYTTIIAQDTYAYNGLLADFQLIVGENEHIANEGPTSYYFFVELS